MLRNHLPIESMPLIARHVSSDEVVVLLGEAERVGRRPIDVVSALLRQALGVRARWSLLSRSRAQSVVVLARAETSLPSLISFLSVIVLAPGHGFPATHDVAGGLDAMVLVHFVVEGSGTDWSAGFEDSELLLIQDLRVGKSLVGVGLAEVRGSHDLLRHHEVVSLGPVDAFLTLNGSNAELRVLKGSAADLPDAANSAHSGRHLRALSSELLDGPWPVLSVLARNLWTVAL